VASGEAPGRMRTGSKHFAAALVVLMVLAGAGCGPIVAYRANVGFGQPVSDEQILALLDRYGVRPVTAYMYFPGLGGGRPRRGILRASTEVT